MTDEKNTPASGAVEAALQTAIDLLWEHAPGIEPRIRSLEAALTSEPKAEGEADLLKRIAELEKLVYVPGLRRCAKCSCKLVTNTFHASTGAISANNEPQVCPNGCGPMWPVTEREAGNEMADRLEAALSAPQPLQGGEVTREQISDWLAEAQRTTPYAVDQAEFIVRKALALISPAQRKGEGA